MRESDTFLETRCAGRVLNERYLVRYCGNVPKTRHASFDAFDRTYDLCIFDSDVAQQIIWKLLVDDSKARFQVPRHSRQTGTILGGFNFEIGIGQNRRNGA